MRVLILSQAVGRNAPNVSNDVITIHRVLMEIGKIPCYASNGRIDNEIIKGIQSVQSHFMVRPDGVVSPVGATRTFLMQWSDKRVARGVELPERLKEAWDWVNPLLPEGSYCSSGYRSAEQQRRILHDFYNTKYRTQIVAKYGQTAYDKAATDLLAYESQVLAMVRGVGQAIAAPGRSKHQQGKAVDIGGPKELDDDQVDVVRLVARAHPALFSGVVLKERNGCVHFEIH